MSIRIITGSTGTNHVTSQDDGSLNQVILGSKSVVLDIGEKLAAVVVDNNTVRISDGDLLLQGRHARIDAGTVEDMTIGTGTIEMNRNDLIVARYTLDVATGFENIELIVLEGAESTGSASDPAYNTGDIRTGSSIVDFPLYRVRIEGINIVGLVRLFEISGGANSSLIGNAYSATKSYKSGEYCIDNGIMWRSRIDNNIGNTPAENSYWTRASIANDVSTLNQNLTHLGDMDLLWETSTAISTKTIVSLANNLSNYKYIGIEVQINGEPYGTVFNMIPLARLIMSKENNESLIASRDTYQSSVTYNQNMAIQYYTDTQIAIMSLRVAGWTLRRAKIWGIK